jgi:hypothetical protein
MTAFRSLSEPEGVGFYPLDISERDGGRCCGGDPVIEREQVVSGFGCENDLP